MVKFGIGQAVTRVEDQRLLTGQGTYTDDVVAEGQAAAVILRSPHAHARVRGIDTAAAAALPGVIAILTHADVVADGLGDLPCLVPITNRDGSQRVDLPRPILEGDTVRAIGTAVALVIAETPAQARDAAEAIEVDYEALPAVHDMREAIADGAPQLYAEVPNNLSFDWELGDKAATDAAFAAAAKVVRLELVNNRVIANSMEPRGALGIWDPATKRTTLYSSTQGTSLIHGLLTGTILKCEPKELRCMTTDVGGGFGMKIFLYPEQCLIAWATRKLQRSIKYTPDRSEAFVADNMGRDHWSEAEAALDADARITAIRVTTLANLGGYLSNFAPFIPTMCGTHMITGVYDVPASYAIVKGVLTNTTPVDAYRGAGRPEAAYLIERLVDVIAAETGLGRDEVRRRNFIPPAAMPYDTALGNTYDSGDFATVMQVAMERADWAGFPARKAEAAARGKLRGLGLGYYIEKCGGDEPETAELKFVENDAGDGLEIRIGSVSNGQGHETAFAQVISGTLGIDAERIRLVQGDSDVTPPGMTGGSRALPVGGVAMLLASRAIIDKGKKVAAKAMEAAAADIEFDDGIFQVAGTDKYMDLFEVARAARDPANLEEGMEPGLDERHERNPEAATFPNGCHVVEVEVDPETGDLSIERYTVVDDFGAVINPVLLAGQVHGGIAQGVGQALLENVVWDADGQLVSGSYMDYAMPRADDLPPVDFTTHNVRCTTNPLGIKGAGEAGAIGAPPAVISAVCDALGVTHIDMPATPQKIWAAAQAGGKLAAE